MNFKDAAKSLEEYLDLPVGTMGTHSDPVLVVYSNDPVEVPLTWEGFTVVVKSIAEALKLVSDD